MKELKALEAYNDQYPTTVTIGSFDGVHLGHQQVLSNLKNIAKETDTKSVVISFKPHPRLFFNPKADIQLLTTNQEKSQLLQKQGIDYFILQNFDENFANQTAEEFVKKMVDQLHMKHLLIGYDHKFGKDRSGDYNTIKAFESKYGFKTHLIEPVEINGIQLSSTKIREALKNGDVLTANQFLGYPYLITGKVVKGNQLGRQLGFPTANITVNNPHKLLPKQGVYVVKSIIDQQPVYGMMNLGLRPTINGTKQIIEIHFFDFDKDLYGQTIPVYFIDRLRNEQKFPSLEALQDQLKKDAQSSKNIISKILNKHLSKS